MHTMVITAKIWYHQIMINTTDNPRVRAIRHRVRTAYDKLLELINGPLATMDASKLYQAPEAGAWTIMENIAHVIEFLPYWGDEIARLAAAPGQNFGRTMEHAGRLRAVNEHGTDTLKQATAALPASYNHLEGILQSLHDADLDLEGRHTRFGVRSLDWFIDEFVTTHLENHLQQIQACISALAR